MPCGKALYVCLEVCVRSAIGVILDARILVRVSLDAMKHVLCVDHETRRILSVGRAEGGMSTLYFWRVKPQQSNKERSNEQHHHSSRSLRALRLG
jgi:hypothetical protein